MALAWAVLTFGSALAGCAAPAHGGPAPASSMTAAPAPTGTLHVVIAVAPPEVMVGGKATFKATLVNDGGEPFRYPSCEDPGDVRDDRGQVWAYEVLSPTGFPYEGIAGPLDSICPAPITPEREMAVLAPGERETWTITWGPAPDAAWGTYRFMAFFNGRLNGSADLRVTAGPPGGAPSLNVTADPPTIAAGQQMRVQAVVGNPTHRAFRYQVPACDSPVGFQVVDAAGHVVAHDVTQEPRCTRPSYPANLFPNQTLAGWFAWDGRDQATGAGLHGEFQVVAAFRYIDYDAGNQTVQATAWVRVE